MSLTLTIRSEGLCQMSLYGMDKSNYDKFYKALNEDDDGEREIDWWEMCDGRLVYEKDGSEWAGAQVEKLSSEEFFADHSLEQVSVEDDDGTVADDIQVKRINPWSTNEASEKDRYVVAWMNYEGYEDWHYLLPDDVDEDNFEKDAIYSLTTFLDKGVLKDSWSADGYSSKHLYYIPREKMKAILAEHGAEFELSADQLGDLDGYLDNEQFFDWPVDPHKLADMLKEFRIELSEPDYEVNDCGVEVIEGEDWEQIDSLGASYYDLH